MDFRQANSYLSGLKKFGIRLRLEHTERLLSLLGNPEKRLKCIHVAGTNGKGSVCTFLDSILLEVGFNVGLYTSPHFYRLNERIKVNGKMISDKELARLTSVVKSAASKVSKEFGELTFFEVTTAMAFLYFSEKNVDFVVLEVGLGGRLDATNVVNPLVSVITSVSMDHTELLGKTVEKIAFEKACIIKKDGLVVTGAEGKALEVVEKTCREKNAVLCVVGDEVSVKPLSSSLGRQTFNLFFFGNSYKVSTRLLGRHQMYNAAIAFSVIEMLKTFHKISIAKKSVKKGLLEARIPCRFELVQKNPLVFLDGAHNPDGILKLAEALGEIHYKKLFLVFGCSYNKEYKKMIPLIAKKANSVYA
ncbi:MAG: bifunctional folylpolyglutamate synthase/dihydrofolate synthase, partial [Candidatus Altiarchaeales archaeon]|nr:bifunctional folylpolyglutamate synthase/dihydrofolate synthase [Candidatus Altiarchaeales archaeon]